MTTVRGYAPISSYINGKASYKKNRLYLGNKMSGIKFFNAPWFDETARALWELPVVATVFNPAEHDRHMGLDPMQCPNGSPEEAVEAGFDVARALAADWHWIASFSDALIIGPDWRSSPGTISEIACHQALRLPVWQAGDFLNLWNADELWHKILPPLSSVAAKLRVGTRDPEDDDYDGLVCGCS
jgi:hypothetical protein